MARSGWARCVGLVRYNSRRFVPESGPGNVLSGPIRDIAATADGRVWVSTPDRGVFVLEAGRWRDVGVSNGLPEAGALRLRSFNQRQGYRLFATTRGGVHEWNGNRWQSRALPAALAEEEIFDVLLQAGNTADDDLLWVASFGKGLWRCRGHAACESVPMTVPGPRFNEITSLEHWTDPRDGSEILWVASYGGGLARLQHGAWQRTLAADYGLPSNFLQRLQVQVVQGKQQLWIGTRNGLAHFVDGRWMPLDPNVRFDGASVKALAIGQTASGAPLIWVGSDQGSARLRLLGPWRTMSQAGRRGNGIWAVLREVRAEGEQFWLGTDGEGLVQYSSQGWRHFHVADGLPTEMVRSVARDPATDQLLVGTWGGELSRFDGKRFHVLPTPWPKSDDEAISAMWPDSDGSTMWFGLRESGLARLQHGRWTRYPPDQGYPSRVYDLHRVGDTLWASTSNRGLARIDPDGWHYYGRAEGLPDDMLYAMNVVTQADGRPVLWIGSHNSGVVRVDVSDPQNPRLVTLPALPTPPDPFVYEIIPDGRGNLFVATNYGASLWQPKRDGGFTPTDYHRADGLPHDEANFGALQVDDLNRIWMGTLGGLGVFTPNPVATTARIPAPLVLDELTVDGKPVHLAAVSNKLRLPSGSHDLRFEMELLTGERERGNRYRSQLIGLEKAPTEWSAENQRNFVALPAGDYRIRVEAMDADGVAATPVELAVSIPLPFWRTTPAQVALILAAMVLMFVLLRLRERQQRLREQQLVGLVRQRTLELETRGLELRRINEELTRLSYHDPLTDLANRRMLLERLHGEWDLAQARGTPLAFVLFDLDSFKAYNDKRGHLAGDDCLREIGRRIDAELHKPDDTAGRYGGEEFGVVLPGQTSGKRLADSRAHSPRSRTGRPAAPGHAAGRGHHQRGRGFDAATRRLQRRAADRRGRCRAVSGQGRRQKSGGSGELLSAATPQSAYFVSISRCIGASLASSWFCARNGTLRLFIATCRSSTSALKLARLISSPAWVSRMSRPE